MREVTSYGMYRVIEESLTDRSKVFSVRFPSADGGDVILACLSDHHAQNIAALLQRGVVDVSLRDAA